MQHVHHQIEYKIYDSLEELPQVNKMLMKKAKEASQLAYAPYSKFYVGAALLLENGDIALSSNKENASFPAGICAERNGLNYVSDHFPDQKVVKMAITANPLEFELNEPVSPCGVCRQVMAEFEAQQREAMEFTLMGQSGKVMVISSAKDLLPFHFYLSQLKK